MAYVSPSADLQQAIYERLTADPDMPPLRDGVEEDTPFPYVTIGDMWETPRNVLDNFGNTTTVTLHIWDKARGFKRNHEIKALILELLDHQPMTLPNHRVTMFHYEFSHNLLDQEPFVRHTIVRFRVTTEQDTE